MRDLANYEAEYLQPGFEDIQVKYRRDRILTELRKARARRIVEIGCGMQPLFLFFPSFDYYCFFEPGDLFFQNAARLAQDHGADRIHGFHMPFAFLEEVRAEKPDFIICSSLLHEVEEPAELLDEIRKTASSETLIHINVPNALSLHRRLAKAMGLLKDERDFSVRNTILQQHRVFDREKLHVLVESCGLQVVEEGAVLIKPFSHEQMWRLVNDRFLTPQMLDGLSRLAEELPELGSEIWINCRVGKPG